MHGESIEIHWEDNEDVRWDMTSIVHWFSHEMRLNQEGNEWIMEWLMMLNGDLTKIKTEDKICRKYSNRRDAESTSVRRFSKIFKIRIIFCGLSVCFNSISNIGVNFPMNLLRRE